MGLHVGILGAEQFLHSVAGQVLDHVNYPAPAVIAVARVAFGIFVGQARAHGAHDVVADKVFRGDQFDALELTLVLELDEFK